MLRILCKRSIICSPSLQIKLTLNSALLIRKGTGCAFTPKASRWGYISRHAAPPLLSHLYLNCLQHLTSGTMVQHQVRCVHFLIHHLVIPPHPSLTPHASPSVTKSTNIIFLPLPLPHLSGCMSVTVCHVPPNVTALNKLFSAEEIQDGTQADGAQKPCKASQPPRQDLTPTSLGINP
jgi:hypothetical protein